MSFRLLLIDDDEIFIMMSKFMIKESDFHPSPLSFEDGLAAADFLKNNYQPNDRYVIFLDINMPKMDGWEFLESIKEFANPSNTFVFMVSSSTDDEDVAKACKNQFVLKFMSKPILTDTLIQLKEMPELKQLFKDGK
ncbi:response regulator [Marivirga sp. S37H4]|uniref:Response regulator n=1 Tax=Marivirga aurantiaca TaxID=2802615 RepID=A0A934WZR3_9BACT|nr:response regulator [Marivirga aurantiaca]MBK6265756.1 response regulator [Marivirga aurantiaca]